MGYKLTGIKSATPLELPCKKKMYHTVEEAQDMINYLRENKTVREIHAYKCTICGFWHLTSKSNL
jgi:hypothetical protein